MKEAIFHIMGENCRPMKPIPLRVIIGHAAAAYSNHMQTLKRLDERGGLDPREALHVLYDLSWNYSDESHRIQRMSIEEADRELRQVVRDRYPKLLAAEQALTGEKPCTHDRPEHIP